MTSEASEACSLGLMHAARLPATGAAGTGSPAPLQVRVSTATNAALVGCDSPATFAADCSRGREQAGQQAGADRCGWMAGEAAELQALVAS